MSRIFGLAVTQIFNLLYRRFSTCWPSDFKRANDSDMIYGGPAADYKSAIQEIENLRYDLRQTAAFLPPTRP
jgi:hypothetical protein